MRPNETTEEGAIGGEKDPTTSQEGGKQFFDYLHKKNHTFDPCNTAIK